MLLLSSVTIVGNGSLNNSTLQNDLHIIGVNVYVINLVKSFFRFFLVFFTGIQCYSDHSFLICILLEAFPSKLQATLDTEKSRYFYFIEIFTAYHFLYKHDLDSRLSTPILFNFGYVIPRDLSNRRFVRSVARSRLISYDEKKMLLARLHLHRYNWLKVKLHTHLHRIAILTAVRYSQVT